MEHLKTAVVLPSAHCNAARSFEMKSISLSMATLQSRLLAGVRTTTARNSSDATLRGKVFNSSPH
jgi:hypothetical protein